MSRAKLFEAAHVRADTWARRIAQGDLAHSQARESWIPIVDPLADLVGFGESGKAELYQHRLTGKTNLGSTTKRVGRLHAYEANFRGGVWWEDGEGTLRLPRFAKDVTAQALEETRRGDDGFLWVSLDTSKARIRLNGSDMDLLTSGLNHTVAGNIVFSGTADFDGAVDFDSTVNFVGATISGISITELDDVDTTGAGVNDLLQWNGSNWVDATPAAVAGSIALNDLSDVNTAGVVTGNLLEYDGANWVDVTPADMANDASTGIAIGNLKDVDDSISPVTGDLLMWNSASSEWTHTAVSAIAPNSVIVWNGSDWVNATIASLGAQIVHGDLLGLADDDHTQYYLNTGTRAMTQALFDDSPTVRILQDVAWTSDLDFYLPLQSLYSVGAQTDYIASLGGGTSTSNRQDFTGFIGFANPLVLTAAPGAVAEIIIKPSASTPSTAVTVNIPVETGSPTRTMASLERDQEFTGNVDINNNYGIGMIDNATQNKTTILPGANSGDFNANIPALSASDTFAMIGLSQTWTGLPTFSNASGIKTDDINERTSAHGVEIDGVLCKDGSVFDSAQYAMGDNDSGLLEVTDDQILMYSGGVLMQTWWSATHIEMKKNTRFDGDNIKAIFGASQDAEIYYDGTDLIIEPQAVGSGEVVINSGALDVTGATFKLAEGASPTTSNSELIFDTDTNDLVFKDAGGIERRVNMV